MRLLTIFQPDPFNWLFGNGIGTNLGAALVWVPIGAGLGYLWARVRVMPQLRAHRDRVEEVHYLLHRGEPHPRVADQQRRT